MGLLAADFPGSGGRQDGVVKEAERKLHPEDPSYGFIQSALG